MKLVYVAGPYRASTAWGIEQNIRRADEVAAQVWKAGLAAICPHANTRHMDGLTSDENFLDGTMEMLRRCDAVLLVEGWQKSSGSRAEVSEAMRLGKPVMYAWGDESVVADVLYDLAAGHRLEDVKLQDPFSEHYWMGRSK